MITPCPNTAVDLIPHPWTITASSAMGALGNASMCEVKGKAKKAQKRDDTFGLRGRQCFTQSLAHDYGVWGVLSTTDAEAIDSGRQAHTNTPQEAEGGPYAFTCGTKPSAATGVHSLVPSWPGTDG